MSRARLTVPALFLILAGCGPSSDDRPNVLLITVDTLRADHLSCYGYGLETSPQLDLLAAQGVRVEDCTVQWPKTWPSMASLLTGAYPRSTGVQMERKVLPETMTLLSDCFQEAGYETAAVVTNLNIGRSFGFDQGFEEFIQAWDEDAPGSHMERTRATLVTDQALRWLGERGGGPFFLWLHYLDPHGPYDPPGEFASLFEGEHEEHLEDVRRFPKYQVQKDESGRPIPNAGHYRAQYDREIRYLDQELGRLFTGMKQGGQWANTLLVLTADHGESLGEHEYWFEHGLRPYQASARVPLILRWDGQLPAGTVVTEAVGLIDVTPTILELVNLPAPPTFEGTSLAALLKGQAGAPVPTHVFMESGPGANQPQLTVRQGKWKLVWVSSPRDRQAMAHSEFELYDLSEDPHEESNVAADHPDLVRELGQLVQTWYQSPPADAQRALDMSTQSLDSEAIQMLRELGYLK